MNEDHTKWCRDMFALIAPGGIWGLPRTGLVFRKTGNVLLWVGVMPPKIDLGGEDVESAREREFATTFANFSKARVAMWRAHVLRPFESIEEAQRHYNINPGEDMLTEEVALKAGGFARLRKARDV